VEEQDIFCMQKTSLLRCDQPHQLLIELPTTLNK
jgi:hypothetical protein